MDAQVAQMEIDERLGTDKAEFLDQPGRAEGKNLKPSRYIKMQNFILIKDIVTLDEIRLKFMKQGQDISRERLLSEAIRSLSKEVSSGKFELKNP